MSFLRGLFGRTPSPPPSEPGAVKDAVDDLSSFCRDVIRHVGEDVFAEDAMERQVLSVYAFGGIHVLCQQKGFRPPEGHAIFLTLLLKFFGYSAEDSTTKAQAVIDASADRSSHLNRIIHRGIDGFLAWQGDKTAFDGSDFKAVIAVLRKRPPA